MASFVYPFLTIKLAYSESSIAKITFLLPVKIREYHGLNLQSNCLFNIFHFLKYFNIIVNMYYKYHILNKNKLQGFI
jgi:hypothetical protein